MSGSDAQGFANVVATLMSNNNVERSQAEVVYNSYLASNVNKVIEFLCGIIGSSENPVMRNFAAILMRSLVKEDKLKPLAASTVQAMKASILSSLGSEPVSAVSGQHQHFNRYFIYFCSLT